MTLSNGQTGTTPVTFKLPRKKGVVVEISKPGYETQKVIVASKFSAGGGTALAGNVLIGGLIGAGIDGLSGATLSLKPNPVSVTLVPVAPITPDPLPVLASAPVETDVVASSPTNMAADAEGANAAVVVSAETSPPEITPSDSAITVSTTDEPVPTSSPGDAPTNPEPAASAGDQAVISPETPQPE